MLALVLVSHHLPFPAISADFSIFLTISTPNLYTIVFPKQCPQAPETMVPPPNTPSQPHNPTFFNTVLNQSTNTAPLSSSPRAPRQPQPPTFSATQRDQQARNKPYGIAGSGGGDSYEDRQRRDEARSILESVEMLIWYSAARNEVSIHSFLQSPAILVTQLDLVSGLG